jgi:predicted lipid-binding transport protein (Tim44 family)
VVRRIALICLLVAVAGCGGGDDKSDAQQTVRDFVQATKDRDADEFCDELVTQEFLEQTMGATGDKAKESCKREFSNLSGLRVDLVRIEKTKVDGDHATVTVVLKRQGQQITQELRLKKEDGWKLAGGGE